MDFQCFVLRKGHNLLSYDHDTQSSFQKACALPKESKKETNNRRVGDNISRGLLRVSHCRLS